MDRRGFIKTLFVTPFLTPLLLSSDSNTGPFQLFVIGDSPQLFLPSLLRGLNEYGLSAGQTFSILNSHPEGNELKKALSINGWTFNPHSSGADFSISFNPLRHKASSSFALIKNGKIWDIRTRKLYSLWNAMNSHHPSSSRMTTLSFKNTRIQPQPGAYAFVFLEGKKVGRLSLNKNSFRKFRTEKGEISLSIENRKAWVSDSSCRHKICVSAPPASLTGERIICAPNHFLLEIQGPRFVDTIIG